MAEQYAWIILGICLATLFIICKNKIKNRHQHKSGVRKVKRYYYI